MKRTMLAGAVLAIAVLGASPSALATRDPLGYVDGMGLYEYCLSRSTVLTDAYGNTVTITVSGTPATEDVKKGDGTTEKKSKAGKLFGKPQQQGNKYDVCVYTVTVTNESGSSDGTYEVARDTASDTAPKGDQTPAERRGNYGKDHECPPGEYDGNIRVDGSKGPRIELGDKPGGSTIKAPDGTNRENVQIHFGPAMSEGCMTGQTGHEGQNKFMKTVQTQADQDKAAGKPANIRVNVVDRNKPPTKESHQPTRPPPRLNLRGDPV